MANCDVEIKNNILNSDCENPAVKGLKPIGYIGNYDDLNKTAMTFTGNKTSAISLKENAHLYRIYQMGKTPFNGAIKEFAESTYRALWNKTLPFVILNNGADVTFNIIDKLANGKFFTVTENNFAGTNGDNAFEITGYENGMAMTAATDEKWNDEFGGGWSITMQESNATKSGLYLLGKDVETTRAALEALCASVS